MTRRRSPTLATREDTRVPLAIRWTQGSSRATVTVQGTTVTLAAG